MPDTVRQIWLASSDPAEHLRQWVLIIVEGNTYDSGASGEKLVLIKTVIH
jgi:hypothetical protein